MAARLIVLFFSVCLIAGCGKDTLYSSLSEQEANEMVALLHQSGLSAQKRSGSDRLFSVVIASEYFAPAVDVLRAAGYPKKKFQSLGEVFKKEGFVSSPLEERARLNYAQSQELTETIESIDGVVMARVHLALPEEDPLSETVKPSSASVFVKYVRGADLSKRESQIKALLVNSIEGLPYENVTVVLFPAQSTPVFDGLGAGGNSYAFEILIGLLVTIFCVAGFFAWHWWQKQNEGVNKGSTGLTVVGGQANTVNPWKHKSK